MQTWLLHLFKPRLALLLTDVLLLKGNKKNEATPSVFFVVMCIKSFLWKTELIRIKTASFPATIRIVLSFIDFKCAVSVSGRSRKEGRAGRDVCRAGIRLVARALCNPCKRRLSLNRFSSVDTCNEAGILSRNFSIECRLLTSKVLSSREKSQDQKRGRNIIS